VTSTDARVNRSRVVTIAPYSSGWDDAIVDLILPIQQQEFRVPITAEDQPDLRRIPEFYQSGRGEFFVALHEGSVVGTIAIVDYGSGGALRKMFVRADHRGTGLAQRLLDRLLDHARAKAIPRIVLGTLAQMKAAHRFYEKNGFLLVTPDDLPHDFPRMAVDNRFYALDLKPAG
jgi:GNAT superfamily N-acetyltransferase